MNKHEHYQQIRAYADGWKLEYLAKATNEWTAIVDPTFLQNYEYRIVPDAEGWLPWYGGECPVPDDTIVSVLLRGYKKQPEDMPAGDFIWSHIGFKDDIVAYRVAKEEPKPKKVKMWQWVMISKSNPKRPFMYGEYYRCLEDVEQDNPMFNIIQRADWTEIEVEVV